MSSSLRGGSLSTVNVENVVQQYLGVIIKMVSKYWKFLPPNCRQWYSPDDMVNDVILQIVQVWPRFNPSLSTPMTFLYATARNRCRHLVCHQLVSKRRHYSVPFNTQTPLPLPSFQRYLEAKAGVEAVLATASDDLRAILALALGESPLPSPRQYPRPGFNFQNELKTLCHRHGSGLQDFLHVLRYGYANSETV